MDGYLYGLFWLVSFGACVIGSICGVGGGVIIKPVLDALNVQSVSAVSFLSGCTVLCMTCYSVVIGGVSGTSRVDRKIGTPLAMGAAAGGIIGKGLFQAFSVGFQDKDMVGAVQAVCLMIVTFGTLAYVANKKKITTRHMENPAGCVVIGLVLGISSAFMGIGGGPLNLVVLFFFFSMDSKTAAQNSLYIILFSQLASLISTLVTGTVPVFDRILLLIMPAGGILGGMCGRRINEKMRGEWIDGLFFLLMGVIVLICVYNIYFFVF